MIVFMDFICLLNWVSSRGHRKKVCMCGDSEDLLFIYFCPSFDNERRAQLFFGFIHICTYMYREKLVQGPNIMKLPSITKAIYRILSSTVLYYYELLTGQGNFLVKDQMNPSPPPWCQKCENSVKF